MWDQASEANERPGFFALGDPGATAVRTLAAIAGIATLIGVGYLTFGVVVLMALFFGDDPCALGDESCAPTAADRAKGVWVALGGGAAILAGLLAAANAFAFAGTGRRRWGKKWLVFSGIAICVLALAFGLVQLMALFDAQ